MLHKAIAVANGKGGVGKSSLVANLAAIAASSGWRTLAVDLDPQGNLGADLGYRQAGRSDEGRGLSQAVQFQEPLVPIQNVRENLDAVPAGHHTRSLAAVLQALGHDSDTATKLALSNVLEPLEDQYDLVLCDCPPGDTTLGDMALAASRGLVVPAKFDGGSLDGLELMGRRFGDIVGSGVNPNLTLLGVVLFDFALAATKLRGQVEDELREAFSGDVRIFEAAIRHSQRAAFDMRREGVVAIEYEEAAEEDRTERLSLLRRGVEHLRNAGPARSQSARGIADDYVAVSREILEAFGLIALEPTA